MSHKLQYCFDKGKPTLKIGKSFDTITDYGNITDININNNAGKQLQKEVEETFINPRLKDVWALEQAHLIHDKDDSSIFMSRKSDLIDKGCAGIQLKERLAFAIGYDETLSLETIETRGQNPDSLCQLLNKYRFKEIGVTLLMNADVALKYSREVCNLTKVRLFVFKVLPGNTKSILTLVEGKVEKRIYDSYCLGTFPAVTDLLPHQVIKSSLFVCYGADKKPKALQPGHCLPFAILKLRCTRSYDELESHNVKDATSRIQSFIPVTKTLESTTKLEEGLLTNRSSGSSNIMTLPSKRSTDNTDFFASLRTGESHFMETTKNQVQSPVGLQEKDLENGRLKIKMLETIIGFSGKAPSLNNISAGKLLEAAKCVESKEDTQNTSPLSKSSSKNSNEKENLSRKINPKENKSVRDRSRPNFHGRTLLKGGVKPRDIPTCVTSKQGNKLVPADPRQKWKRTEGNSLQFPFFYFSWYQEQRALNKPIETHAASPTKCKHDDLQVRDMEISNGDLKTNSGMHLSSKGYMPMGFSQPVSYPATMVGQCSMEQLVSLPYTITQQTSTVHPSYSAAKNANPRCNRVDDHIRPVKRDTDDGCFYDYALARRMKNLKQDMEPLHGSNLELITGSSMSHATREAGLSGSNIACVRGVEGYDKNSDNSRLRHNSGDLTESRKSRHYRERNYSGNLMQSRHQNRSPRNDREESSHHSQSFFPASYNSEEKYEMGCRKRRHTDDCRSTSVRNPSVSADLEETISKRAKCDSTNVVSESSHVICGEVTMDPPDPENGDKPQNQEEEVETIMTANTVDAMDEKCFEDLMDSYYERQPERPKRYRDSRFSRPPVYDRFYNPPRFSRPVRGRSFSAGSHSYQRKFYG